MQVVYSQVKGDQVVVTALRQTLPFTQERFHLPKPPEQRSIVFQFASTHGAITCAGSSDHETGEEMTEMALALVQLEDKLALHRGSIDKIIWASYGPISDFRVKPSSEENIFYISSTPGLIKPSSRPRADKRSERGSRRYKIHQISARITGEDVGT
ncbi:hypothetical protein F2Q69_00029407 [Brassica cretica]|uniref:Uncharacterized protein n=1 Tax=Brassica cretica TaxID=69181 RepID=A0A8S9RY31_BRACR|nr:hypothetical protein F2Q69_00029407 [Brassica cretica]